MKIRWFPITAALAAADQAAKCYAENKLAKGEERAITDKVVLRHHADGAKYVCGNYRRRGRSSRGGGRNGEHALPDHDKNQTSTGSGSHHSRRKKYGRYDNLCVGDRVVYRSGRSWMRE